MDVGAFRIRFSGKCLAGFDENIVRQTLAQKLGFTPSQLASIFRGRPVTLKNNMERAAAGNYEAKLRSMGMDVRAEPEETAGKTPASPSAPPAAARAVTPSPEAPQRPNGTPPSPAMVPPLPAATSGIAEISAPRRTTPGQITPLAHKQATPIPPPPVRPEATTPQPPSAPVAPPKPESALPPPVLPASQPVSGGELQRTCPRCGAQIPATLPCPACTARTDASAPRPPRPAPPLPSRSHGEPLSTPTAPTPETQYLSTLLAEQELMADHSTDRRIYLSLSFSGRMHGLYYLWWIGITYMLMRGLDVGEVLWRLSPHGSQVAEAPSAPTSLATLLLLFQAARLSVLRLHDIDRSGLWAVAHIAVYLIFGLFISIPVASLIFQFGIMILVIVPSDRHRNRFGSPPQSPDGKLEWFDSGRRCDRQFYLSRCLGVINIALLTSLLLGIGFRLLNWILSTFLPASIHASFGNPTRVLFAVGVIAAALWLRLMISRLHDLSLRGTWILPYLSCCWGLYALMMAPNLGIRWLAVVLINLLSLLLFVALCAIPGKPSSNRFGKVPQETRQSEAWHQVVILAVLCVISMVFGAISARMLPGL